jgi:alpha-methylacyl-CoA racemase
VRPADCGERGAPPTAHAALALPSRPMSGPLTGIRVVELAGIGPGPFCGMVLADQGADVVMVERPSEGSLPIPNPSRRGRRSIVVDLKRPEGVELVLRLVDGSDALIEGYRPGVAERLGLGPDRCLERNPRLVYGRMTGWGQDGPLAETAGHDIDYIALTGALHAIGRRDERPVPPLNLVGDFGGGGMLLAFGVVAALLEARTTGRGQVVDAAMVDGAALLMQPAFELRSWGFWQDRRGVNLLDGGAPFYDTYETADGRAVAVGALEPQFFSQLLRVLEIDPAEVPAQLDVSGWPALRARFEDSFRRKTRDEWVEAFAGTDACVAPVISMDEAIAHPHLAARGTFVRVGDVDQPGPAPRFSGHPRSAPAPPPAPGADTEEVLAAAGLDRDEIERLLEAGVVRAAGGS